MQIGEIANLEYNVVEPYDSIIKILKSLMIKRYLVVKEEENYCGILSIDDIINSPKKLVIDCVSEKPQLDFHVNIDEAMSIMEQKQMWVLPVFKNNILYGVISSKDILNYIKGKDLKIESQLYKIEEQLKRVETLEMQNLFNLGCYHNINNIMMHLQGELHLLSKRIAEKESRKSIIVLETGITSISDQIQDILHIWKKKLSILQSSNLKNTIADIITSFTRFFRCVTFNIILPDTIELIKMEKADLLEILRNLLLNAVQSMNECGVVNLTAHAVFLDKYNTFNLLEGKYISIKVSDKGCGIDKKNVPRIFDLFFTTKPSGTGIGLYLCYSIIKKNNGHIEIESEINKGTTVHVLIPLIEP